MKKTILIILILISLSIASDPTFSQTQFQNKTSGIEGVSEGSPLEIVKYWQVLAIGALVVAVLLVAIAYAIGIGMEMPHIKAWASTELGQIFANVIIIIALIVSVGFIDVLISQITIASDLSIPECHDPGPSCLQAATNEYLGDYVSTIKSGARSILGNNVDASAWANRRVGIYCTTLLCLQVGLTTTIVGHYVLDMDMYAILFEYYTNLLAFAEAQRFFVNQISFKMGPVILAIGVVARSFFFTRKLGGLLIAIAIGIMFVLPAMYIFDWLTLDMTVTADKAVEDSTIICPKECNLAPPLAYLEDGTQLEEIKDIYAVFSVADSTVADEISEGTMATATASNGDAIGMTVTSCYHDYTAEACPTLCRFLPYPHTLTMCINNTNIQRACANLDQQCKIIRLVDTEGVTFDETEYDKCPEECKIIPPLKSNCNQGHCLTSRYDCRIYQRNPDGSLEWWPSPPEDVGNYGKCNDARDCTPNLDAYESCSYVIPQTGKCDELCQDCKPYCRIDGADLDRLPADCKTEGGELRSQCANCPVSCKVRKIDIENLNPPAGICSACDVEKRITYTGLPEDYLTGDCSMEVCPEEYRLMIPRSSCERCLFSEDAYAFSPPIQTACGDVCSPPDNSPVKDAKSYSKIGEDGLVGREEIKNLAKLMLPVYVLPLFNIVTTLVFIIGLSTTLGGDIDIPGITKVF